MDGTSMHHRESGGWRLVAVPLLAAAGMSLAVPTRAAGFTRAQAQAGAQVYEDQCAHCHEEDGQGKDNTFNGLRAPEVVGPTAWPCQPRPFQRLRHQTFRTVKDVYHFVSAMMPADQATRLSPEAYWDVLAFLLKKNDRLADNVPLDEATSAQIVLHPECPPAAAGAAAAPAKPDNAATKGR